MWSEISYLKTDCSIVVLIERVEDVMSIGTRVWKEMEATFQKRKATQGLTSKNTEQKNIMLIVHV